MLGTSKNQFCILIDTTNAKIGVLRTLRKPLCPLRLSFFDRKGREGLRKDRKEFVIIRGSHKASPLFRFVEESLVVSHD